MIWIEPEEPEIIDIDKCMDTLREYIYREMKSRDLSMREFGKMCGTTGRCISHTLGKGGRGMRLDTFLKLSKGFGIPASELLALIEDSVKSDAVK